MQPSDSRPPVGRGSGRPWPVAYPVPRATRRKKGLPGAWAVLFQRAVGSDPAGCASRRAHRVETAIAFRLHNALGTQNERYFVAVHPTAHSLACLRIGVFVPADAARLAPGVGGSPFTGRVSHPLDGEQSFMTSPHRHSPLTSLAWSHHATTPRDGVRSGPQQRDRPAVNHGTEFQSRALEDWAYRRGVQLDFIRLGKPVENAYIESFNGRLRDECLNVHQFTSLAEAKAIIEAWRVDYNQRRPHSSLGHLTPNEFVRQRQEDRALEGAPLQLQPVS